MFGKIKVNLEENSNPNNRSLSESDEGQKASKRRKSKKG
jgi:hypothetical protein